MKKDLPGTIASFAPITVPILLILVNTVCMAMKLESGFAKLAGFIGHPIIAVLAGLLIGLYTLTRKSTVKEVIGQMEDSLASAGNHNPHNRRGRFPRKCFTGFGSRRLRGAADKQHEHARLPPPPSRWPRWCVSPRARER